MATPDPQRDILPSFTVPHHPIPAPLYALPNFFFFLLFSFSSRAKFAFHILADTAIVFVVICPPPDPLLVYWSGPGSSLAVL